MTMKRINRDSKPAEVAMQIAFLPVNSDQCQRRRSWPSVLHLHSNPLARPDVSVELGRTDKVMDVLMSHGKPCWQR